MSEVKVALFDADGVLALPEKFFSQIYARSRGLDVAPFEKFFKEQFPSARLGKTDLKDLISANQDLWQWSGDLDELLAMWFESEDVKNQALLEVVKQARSKGLPCYMATNQERYRGEYIKNVMFKDLFDGYFISSEIGFEKPDPEYFNFVIRAIQKAHSGVEPGNITFIDDSKGHVEAARQLGMNAHVYESVEQVESLVGTS